MRSWSRHSYEQIFVLIVFIVFINLFTSGGITWSKWVILCLGFVYFLQFFGHEKEDGKQLVILKERYAKGELSEEEFLRAREHLRDERLERSNPTAKYFFGITLIVVGGIYIIRNFLDPFFPIPWLPVFLIIMGFFAIFRRSS